MITRILTAAVRPAFETLRHEEEVRRAPWTLVKSYGTIGLVSYLVLSHFSNKETAEKTTKHAEELAYFDKRIANANERIAELEDRLHDYEALAGVLEIEKEKIRQRRRVEEARAIVRRYEEAKAIVVEADAPKGNGAHQYDGVGT